MDGFKSPSCIQEQYVTWWGNRVKGSQVEEGYRGKTSGDGSEGNTS